MSGRLKNPLDRFASYSTQFVIVAARTTENTRLFAEAKASETLAAIDATKSLGAPIRFNGSSSDIYLVLDTRRFTQFTVERMEYEVLINGLQSSASHGNLANEIKMTILDSVGISFVNYLQWLMDSQMQCGFDGLVFMLRVIFVGHNEDGTTETVNTVTIPMMLFSMELSLDSLRGSYECTFMPNFNFDINTHQRWFNIGDASTYFTDTRGITLGAMVDSFVAQLNQKSTNFYNSFSSQMLAAGRPPQNTDSGKYGRRVSYMVTLPKDWDKFTYTGSSIHDALEKAFTKEEKSQQSDAQQKSTAAGASTTPATAAYLSVDPGQTITQVLDVMFKQVNEIQQLANDERLKVGLPIVFYKYLTTVTSDNESFVVHVDVIAFEVPNVVPPTSKTTQSNAGLIDDAFSVVVPDPSGSGNRIKVPRNYFELDYIFTGKNLDILSFDMKIQDLQFLLASNVKVGEGEVFNLSEKGNSSETVDEDGNAQPKFEIASARQYDPILIPLMTQAQLDNFSSYVTPRSTAEGDRMRKDMQSYTRNVSAFYAQSPIMVSVTIKGNPDIMTKFNVDAPAEHRNATTAGADGVVSNANASERDKYRAALESKILRKVQENGGGSGTTRGTFVANRPLGDASYMTSPVFAKINVKGPNVDFKTNELIDGQNFATEVLYNNYYVVMKVVNVIERGVFTQQLELWSHNVYGQGKLTAEDKTKKQPARAPGG